MMDDIQISLFSPSGLSLHEDGDELEKKLSLHRAMQLFEETGQEHWLNFVIEASGVSDAVEMIRVEEGEEKDLNDKGMNCRGLNWSKKDRKWWKNSKTRRADRST